MTLATNFGFNYPPNARFTALESGAADAAAAEAAAKAAKEAAKPDPAAEAQAKLAEAEAKLKDLQATNERLSQHWERTKTLLKPDATQEEAAAALVELYRAQGMSDEQIRLTMNPPAPRAQEREGDPEKKGKEQEDKTDPVVAELNKKLEDLTKIVGSQQVEQARQDQIRLENHLTDLANGALDQNGDLTKLVQKLTSLAGDDPQAAEVQEKAAALRETLASEIRERARARLLTRRQAAGGRWSDAWMGEEAIAAAKDIHAKYRTILPSPERLGRAPEMDTLEDQLSRTQPVKAPEFKPGMTADKASAALKEWGVDFLLRGASSGGKSRT